MRTKLLLNAPSPRPRPDFIPAEVQPVPAENPPVVVSPEEPPRREEPPTATQPEPQSQRSQSRSAELRHAVRRVVRRTLPDAGLRLCATCGCLADEVAALSGHASGRLPASPGTAEPACGTWAGDNRIADKLGGGVERRPGNLPGAVPDAEGSGRYGRAARHIPEPGRSTPPCPRPWHRSERRGRALSWRGIVRGAFSGQSRARIRRIFHSRTVFAARAPRSSRASAFICPSLSRRSQRPGARF